MTAPTAPAPGFYADPLDAGRERWWDGAAWTEDVRPLEAAVAPEPTGAATSPEVPQLADDPMPAAVQVQPSVAPGLLEKPQVQQAPVTPQAAPSAEAPEAEVAPADPAQAAPAVPPGLYPDPFGQAPLRWWDGQQWTTRVSQPGAEIPAQPQPQPQAPQIQPQPGSGGGSTVLPDGDHSRTAASYPSQLYPAGPYAGHRPQRRTAQSELTERLASAVDTVRTDRRVLAGLLAVVIALVAGGWYFFGRGEDMPAPSAVAAAVNLRAGDLPAGWKVEPASSDSDSNDAADEALQRNLDRCLGAPDRASAVTFTAGSPTWSRGNGEIGSEVAVLRSAALAQQDLRAQQNAAVSTCVARVATPALRKSLATDGITLAGLSLTRLPNAPAGGFALRLKMTLVAKGRTVVVFNDTYGFVRGAVEVSLSQNSAGTSPDRATAQRALAQLVARADEEIPAGS